MRWMKRKRMKGGKGEEAKCKHGKKESEENGGKGRTGLEGDAKGEKRSRK